ncbi:RasGEF domain-containing serine/threonine-protein kinase X [Termitomyces sp. T112]|nr:RasGEF domain-containing serine/threonine-protein kinase X [Termitomyces sp. T112]KAH0579790.1 hypothetical protein H2248_002625 [Termitomyces sp. 'cryptogamus']
MHSDAFDVVPFDDIKGEWKKLGAGSFGNVYKGNYLGIEVAIKEVLPSKDYDVAKYFEREWRLMKECRHPNICLFIGLSRAPAPDARIFIVSEFVDSGNVRLYIHDKAKPFPWRLRMSFATDVARALAYLHARKCIHRDLKGENLLVTSNARLKVTDFGFARIAARNEEESKRLTFCGTDAYMSPEILLGEEFDLPTDIFSLGIIFCEIAARHLADDTHFKRHPPTFGIDVDEVHRLASPDCPPDFLALCIECLNTDPSKRPTTRDILERLRVIEAEVAARPSEDEEAHVGSIKFLTGGKRPAGNPRIPSFGMGVGKDIRHNDSASDDESDEELWEALSNIGSCSMASDQPLIDSTPSRTSESRTTVILSHPAQPSATPVPSVSSLLTIQPSPDLNDTLDPLPPVSTPSHPTFDAPKPAIADDPFNSNSILTTASLDSYLTASSAAAASCFSSTLATQGDSTVHSPLVHRFTLHKPGAKPNNVARRTGSISPSQSHGDVSAHWNPLLLFSSGLLMSKCDVCTKRLGWKPILVCDDCDLRCHVKCGENAPHNCGQQQQQPDLFAISPLSRVGQSASNGAIITMTQSLGPVRH